MAATLVREHEFLQIESQQLMEEEGKTQKEKKRERREGERDLVGCSRSGPPRRGAGENKKKKETEERDK